MLYKDESNVDDVEQYTKNRIKECKFIEGKKPDKYWNNIDWYKDKDNDERRFRSDLIERKCLEMQQKNKAELIYHRLVHEGRAFQALIKQVIWLLGTGKQ